MSKFKKLGLVSKSHRSGVGVGGYYEFGVKTQTSWEADIFVKHIELNEEYVAEFQKLISK